MSAQTSTGFQAYLQTIPLKCVATSMSCSSSNRYHTFQIWPPAIHSPHHALNSFSAHTLWAARTQPSQHMAYAVNALNGVASTGINIHVPHLRGCKCKLPVPTHVPPLASSARHSLTTRRLSTWNCSLKLTCITPAVHGYVCTYSL